MVFDFLWFSLLFWLAGAVKLIFLAPEALAQRREELFRFQQTGILYAAFVLSWELLAPGTVVALIEQYIPAQNIPVARVILLLLPTLLALLSNSLAIVLSIILPSLWISCFAYAQASFPGFESLLGFESLHSTLRASEAQTTVRMFVLLLGSGATLVFANKVSQLYLGVIARDYSVKIHQYEKEKRVGVEHGRDPRPARRRDFWLLVLALGFTAFALYWLLGGNVFPKHA